MNGKRRILSVLFFLDLTLGSLPAGAVTPANGGNPYNATATTPNLLGFANMTSRNTTFCYLSRVGVENTDTDGERATCRVTRGAAVWTLEAILGEINDADVVCSAICYNN